MAEDQHARFTTYDTTIDLGDNVELSTKSGAKLKTKVKNDSQWNFVWAKYSTVVLFAYPHRRDELHKYGQHITGQFLSNLDPLLSIEYNLTAQKFFHGHQDLSYADISELSNLSFKIYLPQGQQGGSWGKDRGITGPSQSTKEGRSKRKHIGGSLEFPICHEFNKSSGCRCADC